MSSGPYYARITAAHTSLTGRPAEPRRIFRAGDSIQLNMVHQLIAWRAPLPPEPLYYYSIAILRNMGQAGFFQVHSGDMIYQREKALFGQNTYESTDPMVSAIAVGTVPADPSAAFEEAFWAARAREDTRQAVIQEIVDGENGVEFLPGLWSYQPILVLADGPAEPPGANRIDVSWWDAWTYLILP
jgi:hypothetical protein